MDQPFLDVLLRHDADNQTSPQEVSQGLERVGRDLAVVLAACSPAARSELLAAFGPHGKSSPEALPADRKRPALFAQAVRPTAGSPDASATSSNSGPTRNASARSPWPGLTRGCPRTILSVAIAAGT
jgi:hypothetical protein